MVDFNLIFQLLLVLLIIIISLLINLYIRRKFKQIIEHQKEYKGFVPLHLTKNHFSNVMRLSETRHRILSRVLQGFVYLVGFAIIIYLIPPLRALSYSLLAGAGILAVIIGFAIQKTFANIFSGIFIAIYEPFRIGDFVAVDDKVGVIEDITLHHTVIREWRERRYIIPNSLISETTIKNYTIEKGDIIKTFTVGISYDSDIDLAKRIMIEEMEKNPKIIVPHDKPGNDGKPSVRVIEWADSSIKLRGAFWVAHPIDGYVAKFDLLESIKKRFDAEGVEIPFPYRTIVYKKDLAKPKRNKKHKK